MKIIYLCIWVHGKSKYGTKCFCKWISNCWHIIFQALYNVVRQRTDSAKSTAATGFQFAVNMRNERSKQYLNTTRHWSIKFSHSQPRPTYISKGLQASCCCYSNNIWFVTYASSHDYAERLQISCTTTTTTRAFQCVLKQEECILSHKVLKFQVRKNALVEENEAEAQIYTKRWTGDQQQHYYKKHWILGDEKERGERQVPQMNIF